MKRIITGALVALMALTVMAQPKFSEPHGLYDVTSLTVGITPMDATAEVRYTTDGSEPTAKSSLYTEPLQLTQTTLLRAVEVKNGVVTSVSSTASYIFIASVLNQPNNPEGYPSTWGQYTQFEGTAIADYEMDPEMTNDPMLRPKIIEGLKQLPILSVVSDKGNFFSHENNEETGGIYIYTGPPVGDATGNGWTRPCSAELFGGPQHHDLSINCGVKLHGGHGRLAEKNPKHSIRLVFKKAYGPSDLEYDLFGEGEPNKFDQLVLRCHFGNSWQHWSEGNRQKAQYTRDVWARRMQRKMGHTSVNALYVHLFLNGMYWGLYNIAERVDDQYGKDHLGGKKSDIDVIKIEEEEGNHIEASEGTLDSWNEMVAAVAEATTAEDYQYVSELLDIDNFIDYMLINQYGGNTDWAHHNWYAISSRAAGAPGFRFLCWDSEMILDNVSENVLDKNDGKASPTGIFKSLLQHPQFASRYLKRAKEVLSADGLLGSQSVVEVWDSLYNTISSALYCEAARWGDYRRDVPCGYGSASIVYTVDETYMAERNRLLTQYFPTRTTSVLSQITKYIDVDDFEAPENWEMLTASMYYWWNGTGADAKPLENATVDWNLNKDVSNGGVVTGLVTVDHDLFADISQYDKIVLRGNGGSVRILANRLVPHGEWKEIAPSFNENDPYWNSEYDALVIPLEDFKTKHTTSNNPRVDTFVHLDAIKANNGSTVNVKAIYLVPKEDASGIHTAKGERFIDNGKYYTLQGIEVEHPTKGLYIKNGKKVIIR